MSRPRRGAGRNASTRRSARPNPVGVVHIAAGGYGFVTTPEGEFFVPARKMGGAFDGDTVEVRPSSVNRDRPQPGKEHNVVGKNPSARVVNVVERAHDTIVGRYEVAEPFGVVIPSDSRIRHDIFTLRSEAPHVKDGDLVRVRITQYPGKGTAATGVVEEVLGHAGERGADVNAIVAAHNLRTEFPEGALREARAARVESRQALAAGYRDLRELCMFTIDPPDARDFDDALSLERRGDHWVLGVHIADVSWYVRPGSELEREARLRATSVYLVDRVLPMLPEELSNGVCSLAPGEERRCLSVLMELDDGGALADVTFTPSVICSKARLDYGQVQGFFDTGDAGGIPEEVAVRLGELRGIVRLLKETRRREGALELETPEVHMLLDDEGVPIDVTVRTGTEATGLVEHCMVLANTAVAHHLFGRGEPCLYRVHDAPASSSLSMLVPLLQEFGYGRQVDLELFAAGNARAIQRVLEVSRGKAESELVSILLLRSLKRASYSDACTPHFGLGLMEYLHFTSPIRRYPDLVAHRALKRSLGVQGEAVGTRPANLKLAAEHSSAMERTADEASLQSQELKLVEYLAGFIGQVFEGIICRVASYGFFVRLDNTATGLVGLGSIGDDYYDLDVRRQTLTGRDTGRVLRLGQRIRVRLVDARPTLRELDFELL